MVCEDYDSQKVLDGHMQRLGLDGLGVGQPHNPNRNGLQFGDLGNAQPARSNDDLIVSFFKFSNQERFQHTLRLESGGEFFERAPGLLNVKSVGTSDPPIPYA